jgi:hypothetical protein
VKESTAERVGRVASWLVDVYALDLAIEPERFVVSLSPEQARSLLPIGCRSGLLVFECAGELQLGLHLAPEDRERAGTVVEETSHLVCLAWHAARDLPVSLLVLELQAEIDRFVFARLGARRGARRALAHFERFRFAEELEPEALTRYQFAHERAHRYCISLAERFPRRADTPALLSELRRFYRASPEKKLRLAA